MTDPDPADPAARAARGGGQIAPSRGEADAMAVAREALGALGLPPDASAEPASGGASGAAWHVRVGNRSYILRGEGSSATTDSRLAAMAAARAAGLPAPEVIGRVMTRRGEAVLLTWLPGSTLFDVLARSPGDARAWGVRMGALQRRLHQVVAPRGVLSLTDDHDHPFGAGRDLAALRSGGRLLHLDWHPLNLIADEERGEISGIVDWDNARAGDPSFDLARTRAILTREPSLVMLAPPIRDAIEHLLLGWADGYGTEARSGGPQAELWAATVMLADLEPRYGANASALDPLRAWMRALQDDVGG